jgi:hypothetical protein
MDGCASMNGQQKNDLAVGIALFVTGTIIGVLASNKKARDQVLDVVNEGYVAIKGLSKPKK